MPIRVHYITHVPFEGLGSMQEYFDSPRFNLTHSPQYAEPPLPATDSFDWLIIMGGPMSVLDVDTYSWLQREKDLIGAAINEGKKVLGICLGAQIIAECLGANVFQGRHREIGWHPVTSLLPHDSRWHDVLGDTYDAFHWHGETFDIPRGAVPVASSVACRNQGFIYDDRVVALQFHLETTPHSAASLIKHCGDELDGSLFVQDPAVIMADSQRFDKLNARMSRLLSQLESQQ